MNNNDNAVAPPVWPISAARFAEIWDTRGPQASLKVTDEERRSVNVYWTDGDTSWMDAFHAMWRKVDPEGHRARFARTFYSSAETMRADDEPELPIVVGRSRG